MLCSIVIAFDVVLQLNSAFSDDVSDWFDPKVSFGLV